jgi:hypothetical protein
LPTGRWKPCGRRTFPATAPEVCIYIERDTDFSEANRILISLGAVEERPLSLRLVFALLLVAALLAIWAALAWNT